MSVQYLCVSWQEYHDLAIKLADSLLSRKKHFDEILAIGRGGLITGAILTDLLQLPVSTITIKSYKGVWDQGKLEITAGLGKRIEGKHVLLVDDIVDGGGTLTKAVQYLSSYKPASITSAVIFYKPHSKVKPDFFALETKLWILQPHESTEWTITFGKAMKKEGKTDKQIQAFLTSVGYTKQQIEFTKKYYTF